MALQQSLHLGRRRRRSAPLAKDVEDHVGGIYFLFEFLQCQHAPVGEVVLVADQYICPPDHPRQFGA
ncbi:MAG TPA: hypothetical protein VH575_20850 [Gemmataceae bacterium]|jgi:hypothetical protein